MSALVYSIVVMVVVFTAYMAIVSLSSRKEDVAERLKRLVPSGAGADGATESLTLEQEKTPLAAVLEGIVRIFGVDTQAFVENSQLKFHQAGLFSADAPIYYLFMKKIGMGVILLCAAGMFLLGDTGMGKAFNYLVGVILVVAAVWGPDLYVKNCKQKHQRKLTRSFPDALDLLLVCVESGLALDGALARVCRELGRAHPEVTYELNRTRLELTLLNDRVQALQNLADRTDLVPFKSLVAALMQTERFGTSLADTLRVLSEDYRVQRLMIAENKAGRLPVMITIPLIVLMMPAFFLVILGPSILNLMDIIGKK